MKTNIFPIVVILIFIFNGLKDGQTQSPSNIVELKSAILQPEKHLSLNDTNNIGHYNNMFKVDHVSKDFIFNHYYGRICKWETKRDNKNRQKVRFRLGDPSYVDKLEGK